MLVPTGHALYARERVPEGQEGYEFSVLGDFDANVWDLFRALYDRVQHGLAVRHVERGELGWRITDARHLVGRITWDPDRSGEVPLLVIDGRPFTWDQVGRMLISFEGFTLRLSWATASRSSEAHSWRNRERPESRILSA